MINKMRIAIKKYITIYSNIVIYCCLQQTKTVIKSTDIDDMDHYIVIGVNDKPVEFIVYVSVNGTSAKNYCSIITSSDISFYAKTYKSKDINTKINCCCLL